MSVANAAGQGALLIEDQSIVASPLGAMTLRPETQAPTHFSTSTTAMISMNLAAMLSTIANPPADDNVFAIRSPGLTTSSFFSDGTAAVARFDLFEEAGVIEVAPVPEPGTWAAALLAAPFLFRIRARFRRTQP